MPANGALQAQQLLCRAPLQAPVTRAAGIARWKHRSIALDVELRFAPRAEDQRTRASLGRRLESHIEAARGQPCFGSAARVVAPGSSAESPAIHRALRGQACQVLAGAVQSPRCQTAGSPTGRSSGVPTAWRLAGEAPLVILRLAGQSPRRRHPLNSNVRRRRGYRSGRLQQTVSVYTLCRCESPTIRPNARRRLMSVAWISGTECSPCIQGHDGRSRGCSQGIR